MTIVQTYHTFRQKIMQLRPGERINRIRTLAWFLVGLRESESIHLSQIANKIPGQATRPSRTKQMARLMANKHIQVRPWYEPLARRLLTQAAQHQNWVRLLIDCSKVGNGHQLCLVALAYRRRAIPIAWTWVRARKGHSSGRKQNALLAYVAKLVPAKAQVIVTGDSEFTPLQTLLDQIGWFSVLRQKGSHLIRPTPQDEWQRCEALLTQPGRRCSPNRADVG